jgi:prepilin-type processing-associated H-X9-DG protein
MNRKCSGKARLAGAFSLVELLTMVSIISLLAGLLLPSLARAKSNANRVNCSSNLKQAALSFAIWAQDNSGKYPWMLTASEGGTQDTSNQASDQFLVISNEISLPKLLVCPSDKAVSARSTWMEVATNGNLSLSYFAGLCAREQFPRALLLGDRNIAGLSEFSECTNAAGMLASGIQGQAYWENDLHNNAGNLAAADGSVEHLTTAQLQRRAANSGTGSVCSENHVLAPCPGCVLMP